MIWLLLIDLVLLGFYLRWKYKQIKKWQRNKIMKRNSRYDGAVMLKSYLNLKEAHK
ncbi:MAG: hypothetical protein WC373_00850 [Smithella sp.]|jgi:hypothetical protein